MGSADKLAASLLDAPLRTLSRRDDRRCAKHDSREGVSATIVRASFSTRLNRDYLRLVATAAMTIQTTRRSDRAPMVRAS